MRMHWGHAIFSFYGLFVAVLVIVVIKSTAFDNSLVAEDYYARDINYQQEYDRRARSAGLAEGPSVSSAEEALLLRFPPDFDRIQGEAVLYRPSTRLHDRSFELAGSAGRDFELSTEGMPYGRYTLIVEWSAGGMDYLDEFDLDLKPGA